MEKKTSFIAGYELDSGIASTLMNAVLPSICRVTEELMIQGGKDEHVKAAAKTTAFAVAGAMCELLAVKAERLSASSSQETHPLGDRTGQEAEKI